MGKLNKFTSSLLVRIMVPRKDLKIGNAMSWFSYTIGSSAATDALSNERSVAVLSLGNKPSYYGVVSLSMMS
jgi:hypothetical protein